MVKSFRLNTSNICTGFSKHPTSFVQIYVQIEISIKLWMCWNYFSHWVGGWCKSIDNARWSKLWMLKWLHSIWLRARWCARSGHPAAAYCVPLKHSDKYSKYRMQIQQMQDANTANTASTSLFCNIWFLYYRYSTGTFNVSWKLNKKYLKLLAWNLFFRSFSCSLPCVC